MHVYTRCTHTNTYTQIYTDTHTQTQIPEEREVKGQNANNTESISGWKIPQTFFYF